jgi:uncharacterized surface protein with fasciclin (FAS1) repeats
MLHGVRASALAGRLVMKKSFVLIAVAALAGGCERSPEPATAKITGATAAAPAQDEPARAADPAIARDPNAPKNVVDVALGSKDHSTLVAALKAADYVDSLTNPGPFTVFAPTNAAFDKLPKGTLEALVKPDKSADLRKILQYHVAVSEYDVKAIKDGQVLGMANGGKVTLHVKDGKITVNGASILATVKASNGIIHVIDGVLLPPAS